MLLYLLLVAGYTTLIIVSKKFFRYSSEFNYGAYACLSIQIAATILRVFFLNRNWKSPVTIQYFIFGAAFILNLLTLYLLTLLPNNLLAILGFFITYFAHLKIIIFIGYKLSSPLENGQNEENES